MTMVTATVTAEDQGTTWLPLGTRLENYFCVEVRGTFVATVTVEAKRPGSDDATAVEVKTYTSPGIERGNFPGPWLVRARVNTGDFTSGTAVLSVFDDNS